MKETGRDLTGLLIAWGDGDHAARDELMSVIQPELRRLARAHLRRERQGHTLQTDALVNEAYVRLIDQNRVEWASRAHFFRICARMMRRILVDHARRAQAAKRGGEFRKITLDEGRAASDRDELEILALHDALDRLAGLDPRQAEIVQLRYFAGATIEETAEALGIGAATVKRDWATAKAWLHREIAATG